MRKVTETSVRQAALSLQHRQYLSCPRCDLKNSSFPLRDASFKLLTDVGNALYFSHIDPRNVDERIKEWMTSIVKKSPCDSRI